MISFMLCYVSWTSLIDLRSASIHIENEYQGMKMCFINEYKRYIAELESCILVIIE